MEPPVPPGPRRQLTTLGCTCMLLGMLNANPAALDAFLAAWDALCRAATVSHVRLCLRAREALEAGTEGQREAVARALAALGYPQAMVSARHLGKALARLQGRQAADGRAILAAKAERGALWYVVVVERVPRSG